MAEAQKQLLVDFSLIHFISKYKRASRFCAQGELTEGNVGCLRRKVVSYGRKPLERKTGGNQKGLPELIELWRAFSAAILRRPSCYKASCKSHWVARARLGGASNSL